MKLKLFALSLSISINIFSQEINQEKLNNYINYIENNNGGLGSLSIFKDGKEVYNRSFGQGKLTNLGYNKTTKSDSVSHENGYCDFNPEIN